MKYILDTNIVSYWMRGDEAVIRRISEKSPVELAIAIITYAEINYGIEKSPHKKAVRRKRIESIVEQIEILPFDRAAADHYSTIRVYLEKKGVTISERDLQIASIARAKNLCLVTHNVREFSRIPGLVYEDWYCG